MSERYATYLSTGGELAWSDVPRLLQAIAASHVATEWGGALFKPTSAAELLAALQMLQAFDSGLRAARGS